MTHVRALLFGVFEFVVGDDWRSALGIVIVLGAVALLAGAGMSAWWLTPPAVMLLLALSLRRSTRA